MSIEDAKISDIHMEIEIAASADKVWESLTNNISAWWPAEFFAGGEAGARQFTLEATPGGRMMETWNGGGGMLWGGVVTAEPNAKLQVLGATFPGWGGPAQWYGTWELVSAKNGTLLKFSEHTIGRVSNTEDKEKGWQFLWATLKASVEGTAAPAWTD